MGVCRNRRHWRHRVWILFLFVSLLVLSACVAAPGAAPATAPEAPVEEATAPAESDDDADIDTDMDTAAEVEAEFQRILACVEENFPAELYMTNEFLPDPDAEWEPMECDSVDTVRIGMPWVLNDEEAPWYNAVELGYYADVCIEAILVPGGPGINQIQAVAGGAIDIAVNAAGSAVPAIQASRTPADIVAVGTFLKDNPYIWLGLDDTIPQDQASDMEITPQDLVGKRIGIQGGDDHLINFIINRYNLPADEIQIMEAGFTPDPLLVGAMDYVGAWLVNQPRLLEEQGFMNWTAFRFADWGWNGYSDISAVRREMIEENPDLIRRYLAATYQGVKYLLDDPEASAEIAVQYGVDAQLTPEQALRRFQLQEPLIIGTDDVPLMYMLPERWNEQIAAMVQYDQIEIEACQ